MQAVVESVILVRGPAILVAQHRQEQLAQRPGASGRNYDCAAAL